VLLGIFKQLVLGSLFIVLLLVFHLKKPKKQTKTKKIMVILILVSLLIFVVIFTPISIKNIVSEDIKGLKRGIAKVEFELNLGMEDD
jgi:hypothetical protein